jgi:hypothetical protein
MVPLPPPGFPRMRAKWPSSAGASAIIDDMKYLWLLWDDEKHRFTPDTRANKIILGALFSEHLDAMENIGADPKRDNRRRKVSDAEEVTTSGRIVKLRMSSFCNPNDDDEAKPITIALIFQKKNTSC